MKSYFKILVFALVMITFNSCGSKHTEGDDDNHSSEEINKNKVAVEPVITVATLTQEQIEAVGITFGTIEQKNLTEAIKANGTLRVPNNNKANATSLYGGVIKSLRVQLGDYVRKGQVIATIENPQFVQLQEEYLTIGSRIALAEQELQRQRDLYAGNAGALKNLQNATTELSTLKARKASVQKQVQLMGINPASISDSNLSAALSVTSPVSGTVSAEFAKIGSYVDVASPVVEIVDNSLIHLDLQLFEKDLPYVKIGQVVNFTLTNNPQITYTAKVFNIGSSFEDESKTIAIHCNVTGNKAGLIDGMNITGMVSVQNKMMSAVPNDAIVEADGKFYIFVETDKQPEGADDEDSHKDGELHDPVAERKKSKTNRSFEKIEVAKGVSELGYTAITPIVQIPVGVKIVTKGAFFINAKLSDSGDHGH